MIHYIIYQITNKINGKIYIGKHKTEDINDNYMGSGKHLKHAQRKYGIENFEKTILCECESEEEMNQKERELVNEEFVARNDTYNIALGGYGGDIEKLNAYYNECMEKYGKPPMAVYLDELKSTDIEAYNKFCERGRKCLQQYMDVHGTWWTGQKHKEESKAKIGKANSVAQKGERNSNYGNMWICNDLTKEEKCIKKTDPIPDGWRKGRFFNGWAEEQRKKYYERSKVNFKYISNGIEERPYKIGDEIPEGWELGRLECYKKKHPIQQI